MVFDWLHLGILIFLVVGLVFAGVPLLVSLLVAPKAKGGDFVFTRFTPEWIRITALGDSELHEMLDAMEWIVETLKENINSKTI